MVERWPEDISYDQALYRVFVLKKIDAGLKDIAAGRLFDDEEVMDELERRCDEEENQRQLEVQSRKKPKGNPPAHSERRLPKNGEVVRKPAPKVRRPAS